MNINFKKTKLIPLQSRTIENSDAEHTNNDNTVIMNQNYTETQEASVNPLLNQVTNIPNVPNETELELEPELSTENAYIQNTQDNKTSVPNVLMSQNPPLVLFDNVSTSYPDEPEKLVLRDITFSVSQGEFVLIVGQSGEGKSTILRLINRILQPCAGRVFIAGVDIGTLGPQQIPILRRQIGTVFQDYKLLKNKTVYDNISFALRCVGTPEREINTRVPEIIRLIGLEGKEKSYPQQLSGGEQQRVSIARAMVNKPPLLICDEPTGNLDPKISLGIMNLLTQINNAGTTIIMSTHDNQLVDTLGERVIELHDGKIIRDEEHGNFFASDNTKYINQ